MVYIMSSILQKVINLMARVEYVKPLKTKRICFIYELSAYRAVNTLHFGYKTNVLMFYKAKVAVCSEIRTKHINAMWAPRRIF
jgi:hypothetical protein